MPKVSIIVPTYNSQDYLVECLDSLRNQTLKDIEVIIVDNRSTDRSLPIAHSYALQDSRFKVVLQETNRGQGASVNRGFDMATGEYVAECDSDDFADSDMYRRLYEKSYGADVAWGGWYDHYSAYSQNRGFYNGEGLFRPMDMPKKDRFAFLQFQPHILSAIYRKDFLDDNGLRYREGTTYEDLSFSFRIRTTAETYRTIREPLYYYRRDNPNSGTATINDSLSVLEQYEDIFRWNESHGLNLDKEIKTMRYYSCLWGATRVKGEEDSFWKEASKLFKEDHIDNEFFYTYSSYKDYCKKRDTEWI